MTVLPADQLTVTPLTPVIGAEIGGLDLRQPLGEEQVARIRDLFLQYQVLFFRHQKIDTSGHVAFAKNFGKILHFSGVLAHHPGYEGVQIAHRGGGWHIDATSFFAMPYMTTLHGVTIPPVGGDTMWASLTDAYNALSDEMKQTIEPLYATHISPSFKRPHAPDYPLMARPLVTTHPETGKKALYVNFLVRPHPLIIGWSPEQSAELMAELFAITTAPERVVRFRWTPGTLAMWDNRCTHHCAIDDYGDAERRMERIMVTDPNLPFVEQLI